MSGTSRKAISELVEGDRIVMQKIDGVWASGRYGKADPATAAEIYVVTRVYQDPLELDVGMRLECSKPGSTSRSMGVHPANTRVDVLDEHHPVCGGCGELWPCTHLTIEAAVLQARHELEDVCNHCGERIRGAWHSSIFVDGARRRFHIAPKKHAKCLAAYQAAVAAVGEKRASRPGGGDVSGTRG